MLECWNIRILGSNANRNFFSHYSTIPLFQFLERNALNHATEINNTRSDLKAIKTQLAHVSDLLPSPKEFFRQNSERMDSLVRKSFQNAHSQIPSPSVCLMVVGGYGRAELAPASDIDLLLLYSSSQKEKLPPLVEKILYPLWDLGLDVSCSTRSVNECLKMAQSDLHVKTSLIDGRYLDGEYEFFRNLYSFFTKKILHRKVRKFAEALAKDLHLRHQKYKDPTYTLEPNIKEGKGGLRDFQVGRWVIRAKYKTDRWDSILFPDHSRMLNKSLEFLWTVRNQLHWLSGRKQEDLSFELQEKIAPLLGFSTGTKGIEEMMRQYHLSTQKISNFANDILDHVLHEPSHFKKAFFFFKRRKIDKNFRMAYGEIYFHDPVIFKRDPTQLMTLFGYCQTYQANMDFRTEEAVLESLPLMDDHFRHSGEVNRTFLSILRKGERVETILSKMHELGFLSRYIPEFSEIEGSVHYDLYHVHPVDIHSILAVGELGKLREGSYQADCPLLTSLIREIEKPEILFLTTLLHDIGKGREGEHSSVGAEMTKLIADRMGLPAEDRELVGFLVSHHLILVETAFRRDLHDEQAILRFANQVKTSSRLKMLYLLTFADIKAVGPEAWTSWKNTLLMELFLKASHFFEKGAVAGPFLKGDEMIQKLQESLSPEIISEYAEQLPGRYLSCYSSTEITHHIEMARSIEKELLLVKWEIEKEIQAKVTICTKDRYGLFSKITGSMFINRLNILEAQIHTWENGVALDTFWVEDATKDIDRRLKQFEKDLAEILSGEVPLKDLLSKRKESNWIQQKVIPKVSGEIKINNDDSDFYTIVEVTGEDRIGILYEITQALTDHGCDIHFARISTLGNRIVDVFYVQDTWGEKIEGKQKADSLKQTLLNRITSAHF
jgi:[protein-PII] uridylyltransferase